MTDSLSGTSFLYWCTASATDLRELFLLSGVFCHTLLLHICHSNASATYFKRLFLLSGVFYLTLLPNIWHNLLLSRHPKELAVLPWRLQGLPPKSKTQTRSICLFESHSVEQKVVSIYVLSPYGTLYQSLPQSVTKYLRLTLVFTWNRALKEKFNFYFSRVFS